MSVFDPLKTNNIQDSMLHPFEFEKAYKAVKEIDELKDYLKTQNTLCFVFFACSIYSSLC